jgi:hypothetical protein
VKSELASASHDMTGGMALGSAADASDLIAPIEPATAIAASVSNPAFRAKSIRSSPEGRS